MTRDFRVFLHWLFIFLNQKPTCNLVHKDFSYIVLRLRLPDLIRLEFTHRTHDLRKDIGGVSQRLQKDQNTV